MKPNDRIKWKGGVEEIDFREITPATVAAGAWTPSPKLEWTLIIAGTIFALGMLGLATWAVVLAVRHT